jgi:hypothetical protein
MREGFEKIKDHMKLKCIAFLLLAQTLILIEFWWQTNLEIRIVLDDDIPEKDALDSAVVEGVTEEDRLEARVQLLADVLKKARRSGLNGEL